MTNDGSPDLKIGVTQLVFQTSGNMPLFNNLLKSMHKGIQRAFRQKNRKIKDNPSGPVL